MRQWSYCRGEFGVDIDAIQEFLDEKTAARWLPGVLAPDPVNRQERQRLARGTMPRVRTRVASGVVSGMNTPVQAGPRTRPLSDDRDMDMRKTIQDMRLAISEIRQHCSGKAGRSEPMHTSSLHGYAWPAETTLEDVQVGGAITFVPVTLQHACHMFLCRGSGVHQGFAWPLSQPHARDA